MDFFNDIFHNLALLEFYFLNIIYILLYIDFILSIFFQHSNILTRASHHWCLASNIVLVVCDRPMAIIFPRRMGHSMFVIIMIRFAGRFILGPDMHRPANLITIIINSGFISWNSIVKLCIHITSNYFCSTAGATAVTPYVVIDEEGNDFVNYYKLMGHYMPRGHSARPGL